MRLPFLSDSHLPHLDKAKLRLDCVVCDVEIEDVFQLSSMYCTDTLLFIN